MIDARFDSDGRFAGRRRTVPAWLMSVGLHFAVLLLAGWLVGKGSLPPSIRKDDDRRASIVLVSRQPAAPPSYFQDEAAVDAADSQVAAASYQASVSASDGAGMNDPLTGSDGGPPATTISLPGSDGPLPGQSDVVATVGELGGRGRPFVLPGIDAAAILAEEAARPRAAPPVGVPAEISLFGARSVGRSFVFVIDRSDSMGGSGLGAIAAAARELELAVATLDEDQQFQAVGYNQSTVFFSRSGLTPASEDRKTELVRFVRDLPAFGATEHSRGLLAALRFQPEVIYLLTDGGDPALNGLQLRTIREQAAGRTVIHCLHFGDGADTGRDFLQRLAKENRGSYTYIDMRR